MKTIEKKQESTSVYRSKSISFPSRCRSRFYFLCSIALLDKYPDTVYLFSPADANAEAKCHTLDKCDASPQAMRAADKTTAPLNAKTYIDVLGQHLIRHAIFLKNPVVCRVSGDARAEEETEKPVVKGSILVGAEFWGDDWQ